MKTRVIYVAAAKLFPKLLLTLSNSSRRNYKWSTWPHGGRYPHLRNWSPSRRRRNCLFGRKGRDGENASILSRLDVEIIGKIMYTGENEISSALRNLLVTERATNTGKFEPGETVYTEEQTCAEEFYAVEAPSELMYAKEALAEIV